MRNSGGSECRQRRAFESRHSRTWLYRDSVEVIAATALPFDFHGQLHDRFGGLCQCLHTLVP
jgi:hypothetical protein